MFSKKTATVDSGTDERSNEFVAGEQSITAGPQTRWQRLRPAMAAGAGLFSDGYLQSAIGPVNTCLSTLTFNYETETAADEVSSRS